MERHEPKGMGSLERNGRGRWACWKTMVSVGLGRAEAFLVGCYARAGAWGGAMILAVVSVTVVFFYVNGGTEPFSHGISYAALSEAPFDLGAPNLFRNRILAPLIGWMVHLTGRWFILVPWFFLVAFIALVNVWCRREGAGHTLALVATLGLAFSPVTMHSLVGPGFVEAVSYFLLGSALMNVQRMVLSCACVALAIAAHEASAFLVPAWLLFAARKQITVGWFFQRVLLLVLMLVPYVGYRWWVLQHDGQALSTAYYFSQRNVDSCLAVGPLATGAGIFAVFRLHWLVWAVPLCMLGLRNSRVRWALLLVVSIGLTLVIAFDTTRMFCWAFPLLVIGTVELAKCIGEKRAVVLLVLAWVLNFTIPPYTTTGAESYRLRTIRDHAVR